MFSPFLKSFELTGCSCWVNMCMLKRSCSKLMMGVGCLRPQLGVDGVYVGLEVGEGGQGLGFGVVR